MGRIIDEDGDTVVGRICGKYQRDCGFGGKSTNIGTVDAKEVLNDFRYSAKLNVCPGVHKMTKIQDGHQSKCGHLEKALSSLVIDIKR